MNVSHNTTKQVHVTSWVWLNKEESNFSNALNPNPKANKAFAPLQPLRQWLDNIHVNDRQWAHRFCKMIPAQCPFERDVKLFGKVLFHIPPMCKINPLYEELIGLRFRAICYLADECGEDVTAYC